MRHLARHQFRREEKQKEKGVSTEQKIEAALLMDALRQYRHNDGEGFVFAYDKSSAERLVAMLIESHEMQCLMKTMARKQRDSTTALLNELVKAAEEVIRISDRKHDAWDAAKAAIAKAKGAKL